MKASPLSYLNIHETFDVLLDRWSPDVMNLPKYLEMNGLTEDIFDFPYAFRDDGMKYWDLIERYVTQVVDFFFDESREEVFFGDD